MNRAWSRTIDPVQEPVTIGFAKLHCRGLADVADEDPLFKSYIQAARSAFEEYCQRAAFTSTWVLTQDEFCDAIELPMAAPLQSVSSVTYYDTDGTQQTLATSVYRVDTASTPGRVVLKPDQTWPDVQTERGQAVAITYVAGWSSLTAIPEMVKLGLVMLANHFYENRGAVQIGPGMGSVEVPLGMTWLWAPFRIWAA